VTDFDIPAIFDTLNQHGVRYLVIGGIAVQAYGHNRTTMDLDVIVAARSGDWQPLARALEALEADVRGPNVGKDIDVTDPRMLTIGVAYQLTTKFGDLDVFTGAVPGAAPFDELLERATHVTLGNTEFAIASLDDLIAMKRASGRPRDLADIDALTRT
jgi:predicted nucleotidyltransferase